MGHTVLFADTRRLFLPFNNATMAGWNVFFVVTVIALVLADTQASAVASSCGDLCLSCQQTSEGPNCQECIYPGFVPQGTDCVPESEASVGEVQSASDNCDKRCESCQLVAGDHVCLKCEDGYSPVGSKCEVATGRNLSQEQEQEEAEMVPDWNDSLWPSFF